MNGQIQYGPARPLTSVPTRTIARPKRLADPHRFGVSNHPSRSVILLFGGALLLGGALTAVPREIPTLAISAVLGGAWLSLVLAMTLPSRAERAGTELTQRLGQFRHALNSVGDAPTRTDLERLVVLAERLELKDEELEDELSRIRASIDAIDLVSRLEQGDLPVVAATDLAPGDECHFTAPVRFGRRRVDQYGHLVLTSGWLKFRGSLDVSVAWSEVGGVERAGTDLSGSRTARRRMRRCSTPAAAAAVRGGVIAQHLVRASRPDAPEERAPLYVAAM